MGLRTINDPSGLNNELVERMIGPTAYQVVKHVAEHLDELLGTAGGWRSVNLFVDLDNIATDDRVPGMAVLVRSEKKVYTYNGVTQEFELTFDIQTSLQAKADAVAAANNANNAKTQALAAQNSAEAFAVVSMAKAEESEAYADAAQAAADSIVGKAETNQLHYQTRRVAKGGGLYIQMLDSLTAGSGGGSPRPTFNALGRANLGYGGPGYLPFTNGQAAEIGNGGYYHTPNCNEFDLTTDFNGDTLTKYGIYSPSGGGQQLTGQNALFFFVPKGAWKQGAKVFYLKGPDQAAFTWVQTGMGTRPQTKVECYASTYQLAFFVVDNATEVESGLQFTWAPGSVNATGDSVVFGGDFVDDATKFRPGNLAVGGRKTVNAAKQNQTAMQAFFAATVPAHVSINGGMNDRSIRDATQHLQDLTTIITNIQSGSTVTPITIVQSLEPIDATTTNFRLFTASKIQAARTFDCAFYDERQEFFLNDYPAALAAGFMLGDGVHPSQKGVINQGQLASQKRGWSNGLQDPGERPYSNGGGSTEKIWSGQLDPQHSVALTAPVQAVTGASATFSGKTMTVTAAPSAGFFAVGQLITGSNIPKGTVITSLGSGTGGTGTYAMNNAAEIAVAQSVIGYTLTRSALYKIGITNGYPICTVDIILRMVRAGTSAVRVKHAYTGLTNATTPNQAQLLKAGAVPTIEEKLVITAGDGSDALDVLVEMATNASQQIEFRFSSINYNGELSTSGKYEFLRLGQMGQSFFQN